MQPAIFASPLLVAASAALWLAGCDGCSRERPLSDLERTQALASAIAAPAPPASSAPKRLDTIGHPANVIPGQGPKRVESQVPRMGPAFPILPGEGIGPLRFGATKQTVERLLSAPCDDSTETLCRYVHKALELKLQAGAVTEIRVLRKGREAKRAPDGSIIEYGFFNGALLPDLYFGMHPGALQEQLGPPLKVDPITPMGPDGLSERHVYDGMTLEYDAWSNGQLVLGAVILTKSETAAKKNALVEAELRKKALEAAERKAKSRPTTNPR